MGSSPALVLYPKEITRGLKEHYKNAHCNAVHGTMEIEVIWVSTSGEADSLWWMHAMW